MPVEPLPPATFGARALVTRLVSAGAVLRRLYETRHPDPLGFGLAKSRFSDPTGRAYGVVYLGSSIRVVFNEVILRDRGDARTGSILVPMTELEAYTCAQIEVETSLKLADFTGDGLLKMGVPSDVVGARDQRLARIWSEAVHAHPENVDGIYYPSRLNEERNVALYDRAIAKVRTTSVSRLVDLRDPLASIIDDFELEIP